MKFMNTVVAKTALVVLLLVGCGTGVYADTGNLGSSKVYVRVVSNVSVEALDAVISLGDDDSGDIKSTLGFKVDTNMEAVSLSVHASKLYKGSDPAKTKVAPIDLNVEQGAVYTAANANPLQGAPNTATCSLGNQTDSIDEGMEYYICDSISFESIQDGAFGQEVKVELHWAQIDPENITGDYGGFIYFVTSILDDDISS